MNFTEKVQRLIVLANKAKDIANTKEKSIRKSAEKSPRQLAGMMLANAIFVYLCWLYHDTVAKNDDKYQDNKDVSSMLFKYQSQHLRYKRKAESEDTHYDLAIIELKNGEKLSIPAPMLQKDHALCFLKMAMDQGGYGELPYFKGSEVKTFKLIGELWAAFFAVAHPSDIAWAVRDGLDISEDESTAIRKRCEKEAYPLPI